MKKITLLFSDYEMTRLVRGMDIFDDLKVVVKPPVQVTVKYFRKGRHVKDIRERSAGSKNKLIAIYDDKRTYYRNPDVSSIKVGPDWTFLEDYLPKNHQA